MSLSEMRAAGLFRNSRPFSAFPESRRPAAILCVDDDPLVRRLYLAIFRCTQYMVRCAAGGKEALALFSQRIGGFDVLVTDHEMPEMSGVVLVKILAHRASPKVLVVSGGLTHEVMRDYIQLGVTDFLPKPIESRALLDAVSGLVRPRRTV